MKPKPYTRDEDDLIHAEIIKHKSVKRAAAVLAPIIGRSAGSIQSRYTSFIRRMYPPVKLDVGRGVRCHQEPMELSIAVPQSIIAERERLHAARLAQSDTSRLLGDPPPGYSALDRQRAGA